MYLASTIIGLLVIVANIQTSLQKTYLPIIDGLNLTNPYYVMETLDFAGQKNLIKYHSKKSEHSMVCKNVNDISMYEKEKIQSIIQVAESAEDISTLLEPLLYFEFPTVVLVITNSSQKNNLKSNVLAK